MTAMPVDPAATDYTARLQQMVMPQANFARPNFIQGLTGALFPVQPGVDPQTTQMMQRQAMLALGLGIMGAGSRPGARLGSSLLEGFQGASQTYAGAMNAAFRSQLAKNEQERQQKADERDQKAQELQMKQQERLDRQNAALTAGRVSSGISGASDPASYWNLVRGMPEVQDALKTYQIDPTTITTPEQIAAMGQQLGAAGAVGGPLRQPTPLQLVKVIDPKSGKAVYVPEQLAVGMTPAGGQGFNVTLPDGTTVSMGDQGSQVGPGELAKPTINKLQETIVDSQNRLDRLNQTLTTYKPEYLRARGLIDANTTKLKDFVGMDVSPQDREFLQGYTEFRANAAQDFNQTLKELSGVAVNAHELDRAKASAPSADDRSPAEFEAKARATTKFVTRAIMRANWALKKGIGVKSVDDLSKAMPLEGIDRIYEERANQIWQELGGTPETKAEAIRRANQEFGVAR